MIQWLKSVVNYLTDSYQVRRYVCLICNLSFFSFPASFLLHQFFFLLIYFPLRSSLLSITSFLLYISFFLLSFIFKFIFDCSLSSISNSFSLNFFFCLVYKETCRDLCKIIVETSVFFITGKIVSFDQTLHTFLYKLNKRKKIVKKNVKQKRESNQR